MQTQKWVNLGLLIASTAIFLFLNQLFSSLWDLARLPRPAEWPIEPSQWISFTAAVAAGFSARRSERANRFLNEVALELGKVTWPQRKETVASAGVVIVLVGIAALILFLMDILWGTAIRGLLAL